MADFKFIAQQEDITRRYIERDEREAFGRLVDSFATSLAAVAATDEIRMDIEDEFEADGKDAIDAVLRYQNDEAFASALAVVSEPEEVPAPLTAALDEEFFEGDDSYQEAFCLLPPADTFGDEELARRLQEEEDRGAVFSPAHSAARKRAREEILVSDDDENVTPGGPGVKASTKFDY